MNAIITYFVAAILSSGVFYAAYMLFLRKEPMFRFNRFYLLSSLIFSYLIPLLTFIPEKYSSGIKMPSGSDLIYSITLPAVEINTNNSPTFSIDNWLVYIYLIGVVYFSVRFALRLLSVYQLRRKGTLVIEEEPPICWVESNIPPFSFINTIYLPVNLKGSLNLTEVIRHEQVHINSNHSFDILFSQLMQILCWFNPFISLTEKALREIHEFEADKAVIDSGTNPVTYTKLLFGQDTSALAVVLGNNFNYSLIKRRLTMFYKKNSRFARLKAATVLPTAICIVMLYAISCKQSTESIAPPPPPPPPPPPVEQVTINDSIYTVAENMPQYPGGENERIKYMAKNLQYPESAIQKKIEGTVYISFVVEKDGSVNEVKLIRGIGGDCDSEAIRVVKNMPKWTPGTQDGNTVRVKFNMPVQFRLSNNEKSGMIKTN